MGFRFSYLLIMGSSSLYAQLPANRVGVFDGIVLTTGFGNDIGEYVSGATFEGVNYIYENKGKAAFKPGIGYTRGIFYERRISEKSAINLSFLKSKYTMVTGLYYSNPGAIGGGFGADISYGVFGIKLFYNYQIFDNKKISLFVKGGFGIDNYDFLNNHMYGLSKSLSIAYANAKGGALEPYRGKIHKEYFKYTFPAGISAYYNIWKGISLDISLNYVYVSKGKYFYKDPLFYFEDPLHTAELKIGLSYGF